MHLVSRIAQRVRLTTMGAGPGDDVAADAEIEFAAGESIWTESWYSTRLKKSRRTSNAPGSVCFTSGSMARTALR